LTINVFAEGKYVESTTSLTFPDLPLLALIPQWVKQAFNEGSRKMHQELRNTPPNLLSFLELYFIK
jgi:hypothetical protein